MVLRCKEITKIECPVAFDGDNAFVASQMVSHLKGSHNLTYAETDFLPTIPVEAIPEVSKAETVILAEETPKPEVKVEEPKKEEIKPNFNSFKFKPK